PPGAQLEAILRRWKEIPSERHSTPLVDDLGRRPDELADLLRGLHLHNDTNAPPRRLVGDPLGLLLEILVCHCLPPQVRLSQGWDRGAVVGGESATPRKFQNISYNRRPGRRSLPPATRPWHPAQVIFGCVK